MTRRDFQLISRVFKEQNAPRPLVVAMARALAGTNPRFDHDRFLRASGVGGDRGGCAEVREFHAELRSAVP